MEYNSLLIYFLIAFIVFDFLIFFLIYFKKLRKKLPKYEREYVLKNWERIEKMFESDPRHAVLEADKLLDYLLRKKLNRAQGSLGDNLKLSKVLFSDINAVWTAHKLRNKIAHELNFKPSKSEYAMAKRVFAKALKDLGM